MYNIKKFYFVFLWQLKNWKRNPRIIIAFLLGIVSAVIFGVSYYQFSLEANHPVNIFEAFILNASLDAPVTLMFLGMLVLLADAPFTENSATYSIIRAGRTSWVMGKLFYIVTAACVFYLIFFLSSILIPIRNAVISNDWSIPFKDMTYLQLAVPKYHITFLNPEVLEYLSPLSAAVNSYFLGVLYLIFNGLLLFFINLSGKRVLGFAVCGGWHCIGYLLSGTKFKFFSLYNINLVNLKADMSVFKDGNMGIMGGYIIFLSVILMFVFFNLYCINNVDLKISMGTKE